MSKNRRCAGSCCLGNGTVCLSQVIRVATISGVPISLPSIVFKRNFFKDPPFPLTDYQYILGIRIFQLPVPPSLRLNVKGAGVLQKRYLPFMICKLPSGYKVGVYGFKLIRATEQPFVMCIT